MAPVKSKETQVSIELTLTIGLLDGALKIQLMGH